MIRRQLLAAALLVFGLALGRGAEADELVAFNVQTLKYHCVSCVWARRCTKNCITISSADAVKRGGIPCKVCGGHCN